MKTPFCFGKIATEPNFTDRDSEREHIKNNFKGLVNTILVSPRRWGKSSLINKVNEELSSEPDSPTIVNIDLFNCRTENQFYEQYSKAVIAATCSKFEEFAQSVKKYLSRFSPILSMSDFAGQYELSLTFNVSAVETEVNSIIELPQKIANEKNIKIIVCIDEFQVIAEYKDTMGFQRQLRSIWQKHSDVAYCLFGSKRNMMIEIFSKPKMPLYKFGDIIFLEKIETQNLIDFIQTRFSDTGKSLSPSQAKTIVSLVKNHPYYLQQLSQLVWFRTQKVCTDDNITDAFNGLVGQLSLVFSGILDELTPKQINFLKAVADGVKNFSSTDVLTKYNFGTSANIKNIKNALQKKEILDITKNGIFFQDPIFEYWFKQQKS